jgi:hypothetical protein
MIPYAQSYTATVSARFPKIVHCQGCNLDYVYLIERTATGEGTSFLFLDNSGASQRAGKKAEAALRQKLENELDVVPCPQCGHLTPDMVAEAQRLRYRWLLITGLVFLPITAILFVITMAMDPFRNMPDTINRMWILTGISGLLMIGLPILSLFLRKRYNPNADDLDGRLALGQSRAISLAQFVAMSQPQPSSPLPRLNPPSTDLPDLEQR